jgi:ABC-2 type transport system permease protein
MRPELIVAEKEFRDHITSKRFIVILTLLMVLAMYGMSQGLDAYNLQLDLYKKSHDMSNPYAQQMVNNLRQMIKDAQDRGEPPEVLQGLHYQLDQYLNQPMPSVLPVFQSMTWLYTIIGMILGAAMGFDQISRERDEGSLKFLVSSPVYRDAIINGKTIGAITTLALAMAASFVITVAIIMLKGITPGLEDMVRICLFFVAALLYCTVFFGITMLLSTISRNTTMAALSTVGVVFAIAAYSILSGFFAYQIATAIIGPAPAYSYVPVPLNVSDNGSVYGYQSTNDDPTSQYYNRLSMMSTQIGEVLTIVSPINDFGGGFGIGVEGIGAATLSENNYHSYYTYGQGYPYASVSPKRSLLDSLVSVWTKVLAIILEIVISFGIAYFVFMRADVR